MWGHYRSRIVGVFSGSKTMGVFLGPLGKGLGLTTNILWWYKPSFYGRLCPICFSRELGFGGSVFVL